MHARLVASKNSVQKKFTRKAHCPGPIGPGVPGAVLIIRSTKKERAWEKQRMGASLRGTARPSSSTLASTDEFPMNPWRTSENSVTANFAELPF